MKKNYKLGRLVSACHGAEIATATGDIKDAFCVECNTFLGNGTTGELRVAEVVEVSARRKTKSTGR